jgi:hypothetical protein
MNYRDLKIANVNRGSVMRFYARRIKSYFGHAWWHGKRRGDRDNVCAFFPAAFSPIHQ